MNKTSGAGSVLTLNTLVKKTFATVVAIVGVLAGISVFTAPFARTGAALISITLAALAALMLVSVGAAALYTHRKKQITMPVAAIAAIVVLVLAAGSAVGYGVWRTHTAPTASPGTTMPHPSATAVVRASSPSGYAAHVAWTDDGGGGGSTSTTLYEFTGPDAHVHDGQYPLGESLTVMCQILNGRSIQVGPSYKGPDPRSTAWYQLDNGAWVPAVYVQVDNNASVAACT